MENLIKNKILQSVTGLYQVVTGQNVTLDEIVDLSLKLKVTEPLLQSSPHMGKFPMESHILDGDIEDTPFILDL